MKRTLILTISFVLITMLTACGGCGGSNTKSKQNILIAYFSYSGNTKSVAEHLQSLIGGDLFEIKTSDPYPQDRDAVLAQGRKEFDDNFKPALANHLNDIDKYDIVFIGFPIWFSSTPMAILSFLETHNLSNKTIVPFSTRGGGEIGQSVAVIKAASPNSVVLDGFHDINRANFDQAQKLTEEWVKGPGKNIISRK